MNKNLTLLISIFLITVTVYGCGGTGKRASEFRSKVQQNKALDTIEKKYLISGKYLDAAIAYSRLAEKSRRPRKQDFQLRAASALIDGNYNVQAEQLLAEINIKLSNSTLITRKQILLMQVELGKGNPEKVLNRLDNIERRQLSYQQKIQIQSIRANANSQSGNHIEASKARISIDRLLNDKEAKRINQLALLTSLRTLSAQALQRLRDNSDSSTMSGWIDLARITKSYSPQSPALESQIKEWRNNYSNHSALNELIDSLLYTSKEQFSLPTHIALLLPLQGKFAKAATAVRDGFLSSFYNQYSQNAFFKPNVRIYNTSGNAKNIMSFYLSAIQNGADFIVGPLDKKAVTALSRTEQLTVPTLALNYSEEQFQFPDNLYQFGLSPEDEALEVAERAWLDGHTSAIALIPDTKWGQRVLQSFSQRWEELGGIVAQTQLYNPKKNDFSTPIRKVLNLIQSDQRKKSLKAILKHKISFSPRRRQDIDFIFMAAFTRQARQIRPQLKFHHAGDLPVYTTSHVFSGKINRKKDRDMNGVLFGDMPWVLPTARHNKRIKNQITKLWPNTSRKYMRLFALGIDAYNLVPNLNRLVSFRNEFYEGETGNLYLDDKHRIHRRLIWVEFKKGEPVILDQTDL